MNSKKLESMVVAAIMVISFLIALNMILWQTQALNKVKTPSSALVIEGASAGSTSIPAFPIIPRVVGFIVITILLFIALIFIAEQGEKEVETVTKPIESWKVRMLIIAHAIAGILSATYLIMAYFFTPYHELYAWFFVFAPFFTITTLIVYNQLNKKLLPEIYYCVNITLSVTHTLFVIFLCDILWGVPGYIPFPLEDYVIEIALHAILVSVPLSIPNIASLRTAKKYGRKLTIKGKEAEILPTPTTKTPSIVSHTVKKPISESISIERAIYDPCKRDFIEGRLPRMKEWINRYDPGAYWFAVSIQNNTESVIEEWGVELETSSVIKIKEARVEGIEYVLEMYETHPEPYKNVYAIGVPKEYGIVIPKGGAQRVYFKLRAEKPKTTYEISGVFKSAIGEFQIRAKEFKYLCDAGVSPEAVKAELKKTFSEKDAARLALSFKTVQELDRMCDKDAKTEDYLDKVSLLKDYTEGFSEKFTRQVDEFARFMKEEQLEYLDDAYKGKVRRFCTNLVDVWISEFLKG